MTMREMLAHLRLFVAFFLSLFGLGMVLRGGNEGGIFVGAIMGAAGFTSLFLIWLAVRAGEK
jgi:hypothetical protein